MWVVWCDAAGYVDFGIQQYYVADAGTAHDDINGLILLSADARDDEVMSLYSENRTSGVKLKCGGSGRHILWISHWTIIPMIDCKKCLL